MLNRRAFIKSLSALAAGTAVAGPLTSHAGSGGGKGGHVVVIGGGYGGATAAKYLRMWSQGKVAVTLVERNPRFISCPISNLVIGGVKTLGDITLSYDGLKSTWGVKIIQDDVVGIDPSKRRVRLAQGGTLGYDRVVLAPGVDFMFDEVGGLAGHTEQVPHAWKAGAQTALLRKQLEAMPDGGVYAIQIPKAPYRCPPGPYERACLVADYFKTAKPKSKVIILDANDDIQSKKGLFLHAFNNAYKDIIEYRPNSAILEVDANERIAKLEFDEVKADVLNVIPPMRAGDIAVRAGLPLINDRWVDVDWLTMEAKGVAGVHVLGDAIFPAPTMPKSGHMANQHAKVAAAAILNLLADKAPNPTPVLMNTCYSFVDSKNAIHVASVHQYDADKRTFMPVKGAGGVSAAASELEGQYALGWAKNIWADMLA